METHNFGSVDSIGVVLFLAGVRRCSVPDARFLIHPLSSNFAANSSYEEQKLVETLNSLKIDIDNVANIIAKGTNKSQEDVKNAMAARTTLNPEQAISFGLVHEIKKELIPTGAQIVYMNVQ